MAVVGALTASVTQYRTTKEPKSLSISRDGNAFICSWAINDDNYGAGQYFRFRYLKLDSSGNLGNWTGWLALDSGHTNIAYASTSNSSSISKTATSKVLYFNLSDPYYAFQFEVKGDHKDTYTEIKKPNGDPHAQNYYVYNSEKGWIITSDTSVKKNKKYYYRTVYYVSPYVASPIYYFESPEVNYVTHELTSSTSATFSWTTNTDDKKAFYKTQYQTLLAANHNSSDGSGLNWGSVAINDRINEASGSVSIPETISDTGVSYTRWVRVCARGPANNTGPWVTWKYGYHTYAPPSTASIDKAILAEGTTSSTYIVNVQWRSNSTFMNPVDSNGVIVQYRVSTPSTSISSNGSSVTVSAACPSDDDWTDHQTFRPEDTYTQIPVTTSLVDKAIFVRVKTMHDYSSNYRVSSPRPVTYSATVLSPPTISSVQPQSSSVYRVTISKQTALIHAFTLIWYRTSKNNELKLLGVIPYNSTYADVVIPYNELAQGEVPTFGVQAAIGTYSPVSATSQSSPTYFTFTPDSTYPMVSSINWEGGAVPIPPTITAFKKNSSTIQVAWSSVWQDATQAELSWSNHNDAWESTDEPTVYVVNNSHASSWNISGLSVDSWYIRVRLLKTVGESITYGTYSDIVGPIELATAPDTPALLLNKSVVPVGATVTCSWAYVVSEDGSTQASARLYEAYIPVLNPSGNPKALGYYEKVNDAFVLTNDTSVVGSKTYYREHGDQLVETKTADSIYFTVPDTWHAGETHYLCIQVTSGYGMSSGFSHPVPLTIANEIGTVNLNTSLSNYTYVVDYIYSEVSDPDPAVNPHAQGYYELYDGDYILSEDTELDPEKTYYTRTAIETTDLSLRSLPLTVTATGAGYDGITTYIVERACDVDPAMPDESHRVGHDGETVAIVKGVGENSVTIGDSVDSLIGKLNDGKEYRIYAIAEDRYNQTAQSDPINFFVHWAHKAQIPEAEIEVNEDKLVTFITPKMPESGYMAGDVCDIYRLSVEKPELIYKGARFGQKYVDPYPTLGQFGGHRLVYRTLNGDDIAIVDGGMMKAWKDYPDADTNDIQDLFSIVIDFDGRQLVLPYNVSVSNSWKKDFTETKYLGGGVVGDWNPSTSKSVSLSTVILVEIEPDKIEILNRLATYSGACHVRTPDGASFAANVEVKDDREDRWVNRLSKVSLTITKILSEDFDGLTYDEWLKMQPADDKYAEEGDEPDAI